MFCYNCHGPWRYRLGVRTEDSQSSNPGSIPGSATNSSFGLLAPQPFATLRISPAGSPPPINPRGGRAQDWRTIRFGRIMGWEMGIEPTLKRTFNNMQCSG